MLDVDATIVIAHSEKERATRTFKKTFGYHPVGVWCDYTREFLAAVVVRVRVGPVGQLLAGAEGDGRVQELG